MHISIYPLNNIPLYNNDLESDFHFPKEVEKFRDLIRDSDALLISSPEYNGSVTGVLKNALEWASWKDIHTTRPLEGKAVAIIGDGGGSGTKNSQKHLQSILNHTKSTIIDNTYVGIEHTWKYVTNFDKANKISSVIGILGMLNLPVIKYFVCKKQLKIEDFSVSWVLVVFRWFDKLNFCRSI